MKESSLGFRLQWPPRFATMTRGRSMFRTIYTYMSLVLLFFLFLPAVAAENWPQWRGLSSDGIFNSTGLPVSWSVDENIKWKVTLSGLGVSSPIIWGDTIFVTSQKGHVQGDSPFFPVGVFFSFTKKPPIQIALSHGSSLWLHAGHPPQGWSSASCWTAARRVP